LGWPPQLRNVWATISTFSVHLSLDSMSKTYNTRQDLHLSTVQEKREENTPPKKHCHSWCCYCCNDQNKTWHNTQQDLYLSEVRQGNLRQLLLLLLLLTIKPETKSIPDSASSLSVIDLG
jgi:hypothetical protein